MYLTVHALFYSWQLFSFLATKYVLYIRPILGSLSVWAPGLYGGDLPTVSVICCLMLSLKLGKSIASGNYFVILHSEPVERLLCMRLRKRK